jgi:hypothetical protein
MGLCTGEEVKVGAGHVAINLPHGQKSCVDSFSRLDTVQQQLPPGDTMCGSRAACSSRVRGMNEKL